MADQGVEELGGAQDTSAGRLDAAQFVLIHATHVEATLLEAGALDIEGEGLGLLSDFEFSDEVQERRHAVGVDHQAFDGP